MKPKITSIVPSSSLIPDDPILYRKELVVENINWISNDQPARLIILARIRYRQPLQRCKISLVSCSDSRRFCVWFEEQQRAVAPGQSVVFYLPAEASAGAGDGEEMLGGGVIKH